MDSRLIISSHGQLGNKIHEGTWELISPSLICPLDHIGSSDNLELGINLRILSYLKYLFYCERLLHLYHNNYRLYALSNWDFDFNVFIS